MNAISLICLFAIAGASVGCKSVRIRTKHEDVRTGLFGNDREKLIENFKKILPKQTRLADLTVLGFVETNNVLRIPGVAGYQRIFGEEMFRDGDGKKLADGLAEFNDFLLIEIPYRDITNNSDRIYISKKDTHIRGWDITLQIGLRGDLVVYRTDPNAVYRDTYESDRAFLKGIIEFMGEFFSPFTKLVGTIP
ncbi:MAG: hypothetical protein A2928_04030 [Candidatus Taylorbacteria bacterium RIFCSPLOWO2_01_FULL_45_15b]|uniref:Uncharacterized protein n=1 Tax=Candidatus Taylorbacteria bacterium RIFCSPLOWO2_01_FULL_45_15b TaxID=1802319 RepID=A0A1G2NHW0_9BACT|nr:MAG: hypothetical protein A2928_04030 [Candidatus Taylorbacteria bacterium RIFCSPLOWO2_01_FULL_45_15b]